MTPSISADVLSIIALCFTIGMAKRHVIENSNKNKNYIAVSMTTIILLVLEITTILMSLSDNNTLIIPNRIVNILGFSLSPVVPFILYLLSYKKNKGTLYKKFINLPLYFNALMCVLSYKTGWIFFVDSQNQYTRGNLFLLPTIISLFYFGLMVISVIKNIAEYEIGDRISFIAIILIPILATTFQILFHNLILIWNCVALCLLLYYIFLRELQFTYDMQTGVKNRSAFEKEMEQYVKYNKNAAIFVFDLNNLKETNDVYGHKVGDEMLLDAAKIINECFMSIGTTYRIGGDEFCVICKEPSRQLVEFTISNLDDLIIKVNQNRQNKILLACGYAFYNKKESESIYSAFSQADKVMYTHKAKLKRKYRGEHGGTVLLG